MGSVFDRPRYNPDAADPPQPEDRGADVARLQPGDEISVPMNGFAGAFMPESFKYTGIYVGDGWVVSKYQMGAEFEYRAEWTTGIIAIEQIANHRWEGWKFERSGGLNAAQKALVMLQGYMTGIKEVYHPQTNNSNHFTEMCLSRGIGEEL